MTRSFIPNRRAFLRTLAGLCGVAAGGAVSPRMLFAAPDTEALLLNCLPGIFDARIDVLKRVGHAWLQSVSGPATAHSLADLLLAEVAGLRLACARGEPEKIRQLLAQQSRKDFANGAICSVDGYFLAQTDCRVCGLLALLRPA